MTKNLENHGLALEVLNERLGHGNRDVLSVAQVWSLTQFFSVGFLDTRIKGKNVFFTSTQSTLASLVFDGIPEPPRLA